MENGNIIDDQISAKNSLNPSTRPSMSRLRSNGSWCPKYQDDYLEIDLGSLYKIKMIAVQGLATAYCIKYGTGGKGEGVRQYGRTTGPGCKELSSEPSEKPHLLKNLEPFIARIIRIKPVRGQSRCTRLEIYGCLSENIISDAHRRAVWKRIPYTTYQYQINHIRLPWEDARSYCLEQKADLLSTSTQAVANYMEAVLNTLSPYGWWIGLTDRDYSLHYYWTDGSPVHYIAWGGYISRYNTDGCVYYRKYGRNWRADRCSSLRPFVCMKKDLSKYNATQRKTDGAIGNGVTGVWMSSATHYWPLSAVKGGKIFGTKDGRAFGDIKVISGVKNKPKSALQFSKPGMYIEVPFEEDYCLTFPDICPLKQLTISFMASFDAAAKSWRNVTIFDSLGGNKDFSTGISVYIDENKLWFLVSYAAQFWKTSVTLQGDGNWRHYVVISSPDSIQVFVNGKRLNAGQDQPIFRTSVHLKNIKRNFSIGLQPNAKVTSGVIGLAMFAFWEGIIAEKDVQTIYKTEFGWCPVGWISFGMSCYEFTTRRLPWNSARGMCQRLGGDLVTISSPVEQAFINRNIEQTSWIGLKDFSLSRRSRRSLRPYRPRFASLPRIYLRNSKLNFLWANRAPTLYTNWRSHSSFMYRSWQTCVAALATQTSHGFWAQMQCFSFAASICEKEKDETKPVVNTTVVDTPKFTRVCQFSRATLSCPIGSVIKIDEAFWGRRRRDVCRYVSIINCGLDNIPEVTKKLREQCDGSSNCKVEASQNKLLEICKGVKKYLEVNYTCISKEKMKTPCSPGWIRSKHGGDLACYRFMQSRQNWSDAEKTCKEFGAKLMSITEKSEQVLATTLMERAWNTDVWIGLSLSNNEFIWSDGAPVTWTNWGVGNPRGSWTGKRCGYMNLERSLRDLMYWKLGKCSEEKQFICKKIVRRNNPPSTPKKDASCSFGWTPFKNKCYKFYSNMITWEQARRNCRSFRTSISRLVTITSKEENDFVSNLANTTIWIGLEGRGVYRGHVWTDNTAVGFTNWDIGQPDSYNGRDTCTELYAEIGNWGDVNCYSRRPYVCKRDSLATAGPLPTAGTTLVNSTRCKTGWYLFNNMCYTASDTRNSSGYKAWYDAETYCKLMGGNLASISSSEENAYIKQLIRTKSGYSFWIGLHDMAGESLYEWSDGTGYGKFMNWVSGEPNNYHRQEDCIAMIRGSGAWNDNHCSSRKSFVCKSSTVDTPIKPTRIKPIKNSGYCPPGWFQNGGYCYEFHTNKNEYRSWYDAKSTCEQGTNSSSVGELVSITNEIEQAFITLHLNGVEAPLWIGMNNLHLTSSFYWADNSPSNYFHWNKGQPSNTWRLCVVISPFRRNAGKWSTTSCTSSTYGFICKTAAKEAPVTAPTITPVTTEVPKFTCGKEYMKYDESCYMLVNTPKTFDEAKKACKAKNKDAELISVDSEFEQALLVYLMERKLGSVWIGLSKKPWSALKFTDHSSPIYSFWGAGQPNRQLDEETCVQANVSGSHVGRWDDVDCSKKNVFICEIYHGEPKVTLEENGTCEVGWTKYRKNCYKHFQRYTSWPASRYFCLRNGGDLLSIGDDEEQDFAMTYFSNKPRSWLWLGLHDRSFEGGYEWSDYTPVKYTNWKDGQPNDARQTQNCVLMDSRSGRWLDWLCASSYSFVCKKPLECSSKIPLNKEMITVSSRIAANLSEDQAILGANNPRNSAWCPDKKDTSPRIRIDLFGVYKITSITTRGRTESGVFKKFFSNSFYVEYTTDGETWKTYLRKGIPEKIFSNVNGYGLFTKAFYPPIVASSIAILPTVSGVESPCMRLSLQGCEFVCQSALGMSNMKIRNNQITASSFKYPDNPPENARRRLKGWCAEANDEKQWIQVNFGQINTVTKIRTFGDTKDNYVKRYKIQFSGDGFKWVDYKQYGAVRVFMGNQHALHPVTHSLSNVVQAQFIRIIPLTWNNNICMRFELFGCVAACNGPLIKGESNTISETKLISSDPEFEGELARMDSGKAWCPDKKKGVYLQVDFMKTVRLGLIVTTGSPMNYGKPRRVFVYTLEYYQRGKWYQLSKPIVSDNRKNSTIKSTHSLRSEENKNGIITNRVRIYPKMFTEDGICMRVQFYGCLAGFEIIPTTPPTAEITEASIRITSIEWSDKFNNEFSSEFKATAIIIQNSVEKLYNDDVDSKEGEALREARVKKLRKGSVIADLQLVFNPKFAKNENISKPLMEAVRKGKIGDLTVDKDYFVFKDKSVVSHRSKSGDSGLSNGTIAGVVVTVLLVLLIVVGIGIYWRRKRKRDLYGPKQFNNPILYRSANTDEYDMD
ncbi:uncharacterized protein LOC114519252 isoform X2 [Dendronephthya gigantea]|nr:uncharacterized protein LOC114519252 isoform X2 [Dendronephthya gigantea]